jgi:hypothetical protein
LLASLFLVAWLVAPCSWGWTMKLMGFILALITFLILLRPMNAVYGLMGTNGSVHVFFITFLLITLLFAGVYQLAFFQKAGISFGVNQPHIDYNLYASEPREAKEVLQSDTLVYKRQVNKEWVSEKVVQESKLSYQPIGFWLTWRNTILTALMQEPTDFFQVASTYNETMVDPLLSAEMQKREIIYDKEKSFTFQWILTFQILFSWIFFGVFISLLYNKFRYES